MFIAVWLLIQSTRCVAFVVVQSQELFPGPRSVSCGILPRTCCLPNATHLVVWISQVSRLFLAMTRTFLPLSPPPGFVLSFYKGLWGKPSMILSSAQTPLLCAAGQIHFRHGRGRYRGWDVADTSKPFNKARLVSNKECAVQSTHSEQSDGHSSTVTCQIHTTPVG